MSTLAAATPLPPDVRLMNGVTALLLAGLVLSGLALAVHKLARLPVFAIRHIQVEGEVSRNSVASLRANALPHLSGSFLSMNLRQGREAFEAVPWVRKAQVQRVWPNRLKVRLEEHKPAAYWEQKAEGADANSEASAERALVNSFGEVFEANLGDVEDEDLPVLAGPEGSSTRMLSMWRQLQAVSQGLGETVERLDLSSRGSWRATLDKGAVLELGRGDETEVLARYRQFAASITQITSRFQTPLLTADLRHADGYAVRLRGISTITTPAPKGTARKR
ncbi:FtsQ-type POTRA domain-containing protein [Roseateles sp. DAIF2]|uniref:cell division protein FtsQ/DivIB n=1 Tax=Roseateles sp. DAIF2 TaxID=2714952 RepID=UPI0018A29A6A|nr:cell division protein FtsQ/DivIB [Roseateles sp. DAIF2]QPF75325.1 FtsQ-type POTRA domain-containing protein [Roseateles sp. DAIF2]